MAAASSTDSSARAELAETRVASAEASTARTRIGDLNRRRTPREEHRTNERDSSPGATHLAKSPARQQPSRR
jgi:hypothetical protein